MWQVIVKISNGLSLLVNSEDERFRIIGSSPKVVEKLVFEG